MNGEEIVLALGKQLEAMEQRINERMDKRFDQIDNRLDRIEDGQKLLNDRLFQTEQDVSMLKRVK